MKARDRSQEDVRKVAEGLKRKIQESRLTYRQVEERAGIGRDYLRQVLRGSVKLRLEHVFTILHVLGVPPLDFFAELYPSPYAERPASAPPPTMEQILALLQRSFDDLQRAFSDLHLKTVTILKDERRVELEIPPDDDEPPARRRRLR